GPADRFGGLLRTHGEQGHLTAVSLSQPQRLLDGVLVHLINDVVGRVAVDGVVPPQRPLGAGVGHLLDEYRDAYPGPTRRHGFAAGHELVRPPLSAGMLPGSRVAFSGPPAM